MKFNPKQIENLARVVGALAASSIVGAAIGVARPASVTMGEHIALFVTSVSMLATMLLLLKGQK